MNGYNFTERVRHVLAMAREESRRLRHEYVGTEHILLGLISEGEGIASAVLENLAIDAVEIRDKIEATILTGKAGSTASDLPYTSRAKKVLELSMAEARSLSHNYVGTEHLLLGLLREEKGIAAQVLTDAGLTLDVARAETLRLLGNGANDGQATISAAPASFPLFPPELDALTAAPEHHKLLLDNEVVRVLDTLVPPGATTPLHTHRWPAAYYVLSWSEFVRRDKEGTVLLDTRQTDFNQNAPQALWGAPLAAHTIENVGSAPLHIISVELKKARSGI